MGALEKLRLCGRAVVGRCAGGTEVTWVAGQASGAPRETGG